VRRCRTADGSVRGCGRGRTTRRVAGAAGCCVARLHVARRPARASSAVNRLRPALVVFVALWLGVSCLDISSPVTGIAAITPIIAPTPSVVTGDTLRDTLGRVDSLRVFAFAPNGDT